MKPDAKGFLNPVVDHERCKGCLICERRCPVNKPVRPNPEPENVYACWNRDEVVRLKSTSGGAFSAIAEAVLEKKGCVWGAAFTKNMVLKHKCVENIDELDALRRSKYIQTEIGDTFRKIKEQINENRLVLFVGTPCHVQGLNSFLGENKNENLITTDFICHGVPSPKVFHSYVDWLQKRYGDQLLDLNFRDKRYGWGNAYSSIGKFRRLGERELRNEENGYFYGMKHNLFLRPCCYQCKSNGLKRCSDFTIADFWGLGKKIPFSCPKEKMNGISLLVINSLKGERIFVGQISKRIHVFKRTLTEACAGNHNYRYSSKKNPSTPSFWKEFEKTEQWEVILGYLRLSLFERCKSGIISLLGPRAIQRLREHIGRL
jgi:hypothetical protein